MCMLYVKLTLRNLKRSVREYAIFMLTMVLSMMLMYSFMAVAFSEQVMKLSNHMDAFAQVIIAVSIGMIVVIGWLIAYISKFILNKRSQEFGMYLLMGMKRREVSSMFLLEQFLMGICSLLIGCVLGLFMYQILLAIIQHIFMVNYSFTVEISWQAFGCTLFAFLLLYLIELSKEHRILMKTKIHTLLYQKQQNETVKKKRLFTILFLLLAIVCGAVGMKLFHDTLIRGLSEANETKKLGPAILLLIISIYAFFLGISAFLQKFLDSCKKIKYHRNTMFLFGHLQGRLHSNAIVLATLSLLSLLTISFLCFGMKFKDTTDMTIKSAAPFDLQVMTQNPKVPSKVKGFLNQHKVTYQDHAYQTYAHLNRGSNVEASFEQAFKDTLYDNVNYRTPVYLKYSDYQKLMQLKGKQAPSLKANAYMLVVGKKQQALLETYCRNHAFRIDGKTMHLAHVSNEEILQAIYMIVVPDQYINKASSAQDIHYYVAESKEELPSLWEDEIYAMCSATQMQGNEVVFEDYSSIRLRSSYVENSMFSYITIVFTLFYAAFIFICATGTILATQQLSDLEAQKYEYILLGKMGASRKELHRLLHYQNLLYFLVPLALPALYIFPILNSVDILFTTTDATTPIYAYLGVTLILFFLIYAAYYLLTYLSCRRNLDS